MSRQVDVLAVMERDLQLAVSWRGLAKAKDAREAFKESKYAQHAIAQLIQWAEIAAERLDDSGRSSKALRAAIANVQGPQA